MHTTVKMTTTVTTALKMALLEGRGHRQRVVADGRPM
jgi:hypothetical protein